MTFSIKMFILLLVKINKELKQEENKMKTRTKSGIEVELTTQNLNGEIYGRIDAEHPQAGKVIATGLWGTLEGREGLVDQNASIGKNRGKVCFEIPKADYDEVVMVEIEKRKAEKDAEWNGLIAQLPTVELPTGDGNQSEYTRLMAGANQIRFFNGPEMDGVNMAANRRKNELLREARTHCNHQFVETIEKTLTFDSRRKVTKVHKCSICGLKIKNSVEEDISNEAYWN